MSVMPISDDQSLGVLVHDAARLMRYDFDAQAITLGLTRSRWSVLARLSNHSGIQQQELAKLMDIKPITLTRHLDRLESDGLIERRNDPVDRRAKNVYLTSNAEQVIEQLHEIGAIVREKALLGFSKKEETQLLELLKRVRTNFRPESSGK